MTLATIDDLVVGQMVWSTVAGAEGTALRGGMVVDAGEDEKGPFVLVLDEQATRLWAYYRLGESGKYQSLRPAGLVALRPADVGQVDERRGPAAMHGWARKALLAAALGPTGSGRYVGPRDLELVNAALRLRTESGVEG